MGEILKGSLGSLELRVLEVLWRAGRPSTVRDLLPAFPDSAYTTLMTTLDRLFKKGVLRRSKVARAFLYEPIWSRQETEARVAGLSIEDLLGRDRPSVALGPLLSCFVDAVSERDRALLDHLERLVKAKKRELSQ